MRVFVRFTDFRTELPLVSLPAVIVPERFPTVNTPELLVEVKRLDVPLELAGCRVRFAALGTAEFSW